MSDKEFDQKITEAIASADLAEDLREERRRERAMRSSTFKAIAALEFGPPEQWEEGLLEETIENTIAVDKVRWAERWTWITLVFAVGVGSFAGARLTTPPPTPVPVVVECAIKYEQGVAEDVICEGEQ